MINPGFRAIDPSSADQMMGSGGKRIHHLQDRRNIMFLLMALFLALLIFVVLEVKQNYETKAEMRPALPESVQGK